jgi:hypothetical protein
VTVLSFIIQSALRKRQEKAVSTTAIERIAARLTPQLRKHFLAAVQAAKNNVDLERLAQAIISGNVTKAEIAVKLAEWPEKFGGLAIDLRAGFLAGMGNAYDVFEGSSIQLRMDLINPYAVQYAQRKLPQIVRQYATDARQTIRTIITDAVSGKYTPRDAAKIIIDSIGLHPKYERAVAKLRDTLAADGIAGAQLDAKVERYAQKLLKARATTIARTEIVQAQVSGQRTLWQEAANAGMFNRQTATRVWRTNHEGETNRGNPTPCLICDPMDKQSVPFGGFYDHPTLGGVNVFGDPLVGPPIHPHCLCHEELHF